MWALQKLRKLMTSHFGPNINVNVLLSSPSGDCADLESAKVYQVSFKIIFIHNFYIKINIIKQPLSAHCIPHSPTQLQFFPSK